MASDPDVDVIDHALARHVLTELRNRETDGAAFRQGLAELGRVCGCELADELGTEPVTVRTPLAEAAGERALARSETVVLVTVLRAATPFVEGLLAVMPRARQGVVSASRDEAAGRGPDGRFPVAVEYAKLPAVGDGDIVVVADPMLATGSTACAVLDRVRERGEPERLVMLSAVSAPEGLERVAAAHPNADLLTVAVDDRLDGDGFIVPGLGDAGDRAFGTS